MTDEELGRKIAERGYGRYDRIGRAARELLGKTAPINEMEVGAIREEMRNAIAPNRTASVLESKIIIACADVAYRLAQPVLEEDPDKEAKALAWKFHEAALVIMEIKTPDELWASFKDHQRVGWRAVAKAKGAEDE